MKPLTFARVYGVFGSGSRNVVKCRRKMSSGLIPYIPPEWAKTLKHIPKYKVQVCKCNAGRILFQFSQIFELALNDYIYTRTLDKLLFGVFTQLYLGKKKAIRIKSMGQIPTYQ